MSSNQHSVMQPLNYVSEKMEVEKEECRGAAWRQFLAAYTSSLLCVSCGAMLAWTSPMLPLYRQFGSRPELQPWQDTWVASALPLGAVLGALPAPSVLQLVGTKRTIMLLKVPMLLAWQVMTWSVNLNHLLAGRLMGGLVLGLVSVATPVYISEISAAERRGALGCLFHLQLMVGVAVMYLISHTLGLYGDSFRATLTCSALPLASFLGLCLAPESPVWLASRGREPEAAASLTWLRRPYTTSEQIQGDGGKSMGLLRDPEGRRGLLLSSTLMAAQQLSGISAILFFSDDIFNADSTASAVVNFLLVVGAMGSLMVDLVGRRPLLLLSTCLATCSVAAFSFYCYLQNVRGLALPGLALLPPTAMALFCLAYSLGLGPLPWVMATEFTHPKHRVNVVGMSAVVSWGLGFMVGLGFWPAQRLAGTVPVYAGFSLATLLGGLIVLVWTPETKARHHRDTAKPDTKTSNTSAV